MARITVLGGSGYAGGAVVAEARKRGHEVTSLSRSLPAEQIEGVDYQAGSALDTEKLTQVTEGRDVVLVALSPRGEMAGKVEGVVEQLIAQLADSSTRVGYVGGASSLLVAEGGPRVWDVSHEHIPADVKPEIETGLRTFEQFRNSPEALDWFYVSPPQDFGAWLGTPSKGKYTLGGDVLLRDADGASTISAADLALAIVDEIETPAHHRTRFTAIS